LFNELKKSKHISIITLDFIPTIPIYSGGIESFLSPKLWMSFNKVLFDKIVLNKILLHEADLVIVNSITLSWLGPSLKKNKIPCICFNRETYARSLFGVKKKLMQKLCSYFDKIVYISKYDKVVSDKIEDKKKVIIYDKVSDDLKNLFELKQFEDFNLNVGTKILYLGGNSRIKGPFTIFKLAKKMKGSEQIIFVGGNKKWINSEYRFDSTKISYEFFLFLYYRLNMKKINKNLVFENNLENTKEIFWNAKILLFPSTVPHQSRPIYESWATAVVPIVTNFNNTNEFVNENFGGFVFRKKSIKNLLNQIEYITSNKNLELLRKLKVDNYNRMLVNHNLNSLKSELEDLIENVLIYKKEVKNDYE